MSVVRPPSKARPCARRCGAIGAPTGPWVLLGSNVVDMDEGTPNIQYVDQTGDVGGPWYYEVAAWNGACGEEGPR